MQLQQKLSSCLQLAASKILRSAMSALSATTGQAQPGRRRRPYLARPHIACAQTTAMSMRWAPAIATTGARCAQCAWLQWIETSARVMGTRVMGTGTLVHSLGSMNLSPMILEITSNPPNRPIWFVDDPLWFADTSFCISNTQQLLKITSISALFPQNPCIIQIIALPLQHKNPPSLSTMLKSAGRFIL